MSNRDVEYMREIYNLQTEIADLRTRLEEAERERDETNAFYEMAMETGKKHQKDVIRLNAENATLRKTIGEVREWLFKHRVEKSDYVMGMADQLIKILDRAEKS